MLNSVLLFDAFGNKFVELLGDFLFPNADMTGPYRYLGPIGIDNADSHNHGRSISALGSDRCLNAVGLLVLNGIFHIV